VLPINSAGRGSDEGEEGGGDIKMATPENVRDLGIAGGEGAEGVEGTVEETVARRRTCSRSAVLAEGVKKEMRGEAT
jgi:hypothetical protein